MLRLFSRRRAAGPAQAERTEEVPVEISTADDAPYMTLSDAEAPAALARLASHRIAVAAVAESEAGDSVVVTPRAATALGPAATFAATASTLMPAVEERPMDDTAQDATPPGAKLAVLEAVAPELPQLSSDIVPDHPEAVVKEATNLVPVPALPTASPIPTPTMPAVDSAPIMAQETMQQTAAVRDMAVPVELPAVPDMVAAVEETVAALPAQAAADAVQDVSPTPAAVADATPATLNAGELTMVEKAGAAVAAPREAVEAQVQALMAQVEADTVAQPVTEPAAADVPAPASAQDPAPTLPANPDPASAPVPVSAPIADSAPTSAPAASATRAPAADTEALVAPMAEEERRASSASFATAPSSAALSVAVVESPGAAVVKAAPAASPGALAATLSISTDGVLPEQAGSSASPVKVTIQRKAPPAKPAAVKATPTSARRTDSKSGAFSCFACFGQA